MFPEITRDEVFRIETPRLWLRWPVRADAAALATLMAQACRHEGATVAAVNTNAVENLIATWRANMEAGRGLHLALMLKAGERPVIGVTHSGLDRTIVDPRHRLLGEEAADALRNMSAWLGVHLPPRRVPPMAHQRTFTLSGTLAHACVQA